MRVEMHNFEVKPASLFGKSTVPHICLNYRRGFSGSKWSLLGFEMRRKSKV